ncbi:MAG: zinc-dependent peptidase [Cyclobacteriaceae bacterium]
MGIEVFLWILFLILAVGIGWYFSSHSSSKEHKRPNQKALQQHTEILSKHFSFYRSLPEKSKTIFVKRVERFIKLTQFVPRNMAHVSDEMKVLISASAVQITFGYTDVLLDHFSKIIVYPDQFFSSSSRRYHKGEVNPRFGTIVLSWKHFVEGYTYHEGVNLGLHEMAHALQLENLILNQEFGFMSKKDIADWEILAEKEIEKINSPKESFFRDYGGKNQHEFFAVAVENFFERPKEFEVYHQTLYYSLCRLLRQNPLLLIIDQ